jgi:predicted site-specific integrase-resolvase
MHRANLISPRVAAALRGVTTYTLTRWADAGIIRCVKTEGGHRRYYAEDFTPEQRAVSA